MILAQSLQWTLGSWPALHCSTPQHGVPWALENAWAGGGLRTDGGESTSLSTCPNTVCSCCYKPGPTPTVDNAPVVRMKHHQVERRPGGDGGREHGHADLGVTAPSFCGQVRPKTPPGRDSRKLLSSHRKGRVCLVEKNTDFKATGCMGRWAFGAIGRCTNRNRSVHAAGPHAPGRPLRISFLLQCMKRCPSQSHALERKYKVRNSRYHV